MCIFFVYCLVNQWIKTMQHDFSVSSLCSSTTAFQNLFSTFFFNNMKHSAIPLWTVSLFGKYFVSQFERSGKFGTCVVAYEDKYQWNILPAHLDNSCLSSFCMWLLEMYPWLRYLLRKTQLFLSLKRRIGNIQSAFVAICTVFQDSCTNFIVIYYFISSLSSI